MSLLSELSKISFSASLEAKNDFGAHSEHSPVIHDAELESHSFSSTRLCGSVGRDRRNLLFNPFANKQAFSHTSRRQEPWGISLLKTNCLCALIKPYNDVDDSS